MTVYVAEIAGRGIVAFDAPNEDAAKARLTDKEFLRDLYVFQNEGRPLWDGVAQIHVRGALPEEAETWRASSAPRVNEPDDDEGSSDRRVFLVPVVDPSRDGFDDDDDDGDDNGD